MTAGAPSEFRNELMDALRIVERGDLAPPDMRGAWAGELGQTQFMPSSWMKYAVDFDGNGQPRPPAQRARRAGLHRELSCGLWLAARQGLPAGRPNFAVLQQWNKSEVYAKTIAYFASQLAHAP